MIDVEEKNMIKRKIIKIDEDLCTGCGKCVLKCAEGALAIVDGKAKVISDIFCDGLGACIGECPEGALMIEEREASEFDEKEVEKHLDALNEEKQHIKIHMPQHSAQCSCPSSKTIVYDQPWEESEISSEIPSALRQWPAKLTLVNPNAPYFKTKELLIVSDCSPVVYGDFHRKILKGNPIVMVCPMLGLGNGELDKLEQILKANPIETINLILIEVPCCQNIKIFLEPILANIGRVITVKETIISRDGKIIKETLVEF